MKTALFVFAAFLIAAFFFLMFRTKDVQKPEIKEVVTLGNSPYMPEKPAFQTSIQWLDSVKTLSPVIDGEQVEIPFRFRNTGDKPLVINQVLASCGCTVAEKPEEPIAPGKEGVVKALFKSNGRIGSNHKTVTVYANTPQGSHTLAFDIEVREDKTAKVNY